MLKYPHHFNLTGKRKTVPGIPLKPEQGLQLQKQQLYEKLLHLPSNGQEVQ
jgi:hypothetical protein